MSRWQDNFPWTAAFLRFLWPDGPARRKRWIRFAVAVLLIVAAHVALTLFVASRTQPVIDDFVARYGPMSVTAHRPPFVEDRANKARAVRAAAEVMVLPPVKEGGTKRHEDFAAGRDKDLTASDRDAIRKVVEDNALALSLLDLAAARTGTNWDLHYERGLEMDIPPLLRIMQLAKMNAAAGRLALEDGRWDDALTAVRRGTAIGASLESEPVLIVQLIRLAVAKSNLVLVNRILSGADLRAEQVAALRSAIPGENARHAMQEAFVAETKALAQLTRGESGVRPYSGWRTDGVMGSAIVRAIARPFLLNEERVWLAFTMRRIGELDSPRHARRDPGPGPKVHGWNVLVRIIARDDKTILERADLAEAGAALAEAAIAVERHRIEKGRAPATLAELVPAYLSAVPIDTLTGRAFHYQTNGAAWRVRSEFDRTTMQVERIGLGVPQPLDWSRGTP